MAPLMRSVQFLRSMGLTHSDLSLKGNLFSGA